MSDFRIERLDHLGIVAGICREIGLAEYLDALAGPSQQQVSIGTAMVAMLLNGLGLSNRRLYLVSQFFATKPVEHLLEPGITAEQVHDDCLGRTLDWLYAHDPTALFAGIARQARQRFGIHTHQVHVDAPSFAVTGEYATDLHAHTLAVPCGYSRDHRADLKQWMLALATTRQGEVPVFCQALDGNASDKVSLVAAVEALAEQLRPEHDHDAEQMPIFVGDSGWYSLAEHRLRAQLAATGQTVPNQLKRPTDRPTMRWIFQCFEGVSLVTFQPPHGPPGQDLANVEPLHEQVIRLLGSRCAKLYELSARDCGMWGIWRTRRRARRTPQRDRARLNLVNS